MKNNLKIQRQKKGLTQEQVAHKVGIATRSYQYIESGKRKPSYKVIVKLQKLLKKPIDYLLEQEADETNPTKE